MVRIYRACALDRCRNPRDRNPRGFGEATLGRLTNGFLVTLHPGLYNLRQNSFIYAGSSYGTRGQFPSGSGVKGSRGLLFMLVATQNYL